MRLTPLLVARAQLMTAIELFLEDRDPVSVQSLAGNARELLEAMCRLEGVEPMADLILSDHPGRDKKWLYGTINLYRNCFKHLGKTQAERDSDQATLDQFNDRVNEFLLYVCVEDYVRLRKAMPVPFQIFQVWFSAKNADLIAEQGTADQMRNAFPRIAELTRAKQKALARHLTKEYLDNPDLHSDPRTEPLILKVTDVP